MQGTHSVSAPDLRHPVASTAAHVPWPSECWVGCRRHLWGRKRVSESEGEKVNIELSFRELRNNFLVLLLFFLRFSCCSPGMNITSRDVGFAFVCNFHRGFWIRIGFTWERNIRNEWISRLLGNNKWCPLEDDRLATGLVRMLWYYKVRYSRQEEQESSPQWEVWWSRCMLVKILTSEGQHFECRLT